MKRTALDRTLSRRWKEDFEHHPRHGSSIPEKDESGICIYLIAEKVRNSAKKKSEFLRCMLCNGMDVGFPS